jgi:hypothetical protein
MTKRSLHVLTFLLAAAAGTPVRADSPSPSFRRDVAPILLEKCLACHGPQKAEGSYRVDTFERLMTAGDSGLAPFTSGDLDDSERLRRIASEDESERMPLDSEPLPEERVARIKTWIEQGAKFDGPDPQAPLASLIPRAAHPDPPEVYPATLPVTALAFTKDGRHLVVGGYHEVMLWNVEDGRLVNRIRDIGQRTYGLDVSPEGTTLAVACGAPGQLGEIRLVDLAAGKATDVLATTTDVVLDVKFSPDGKRLASGGADSLIRIHEVVTRQQQRAITSHSDWVTAVAWSSHGTRLASASRDKSAKVFDASSGELLVTYSGHNDAVSGAAFHPDGEQVYSSGGDRKIHLWNIAEAKKVAEITGFGGEMFKLHRRGAALFAGSADKTVRQFDAVTRGQMRVYGGHTDWVVSTAVHEATKRLAAGTFDGNLVIWNTEDGKQLKAFGAAPGYSSSGG